MYTYFIRRYNSCKIVVVIYIASIAIINSSCKKFVEIEPPTTSLVAANVFENNETATAAQLAIYAQIQAYPQRIESQTGLSADELTNYSTALTTNNLYTNALNASTDEVGIWSAGYKFIYQINAILEGVSNSLKITSTVKKQLIGESKFMRAFWYFNIVNLHGDAPLVLSTDYSFNTQLSRSSKDLVYEQIISDLIDAQSLLAENYVDLTNTGSTTERIRPNKSAATALLARVYLYTEKWDKAEEQATAVINNITLYKLTSLDSSFLMNNKEAIWQLQPISTYKYTPEAAGFILTNNPATNNGYALSTQLLNSFEPGDNRRIKWISSYTSTTAPIATYYFPYKYKAGSTSTALTEYSMILRLPEQYLIRAEARAKQNNMSGAADDLNVLRNRARAVPTIAIPDPLPSIANNLTQPNILTVIAHERQVELFTEGHRWFDLKRTKTVDSVMTTVTPQKGGTWQTYQQLYPIPITDVQNSAGRLIQNIGY